MNKTGEYQKYMSNRSKDTGENIRPQIMSTNSSRSARHKIKIKISQIPQKLYQNVGLDETNTVLTTKIKIR